MIDFIDMLARPYRLLSLSWMMYCCLCNSLRLISLCRLALDFRNILSSAALFVSSAFLVSESTMDSWATSFSMSSVNASMASASPRSPGAAS